MKNYMYVEIRFKPKSMIQAYLKQKKKKYLMKLLDRSLLAIRQLYCFVSVCIATSPSKKVKVIEEPLETVTTGKETRTCTHASLLSACISQDNIGQEMIFIELQDLFA